MDLSRVIAPFVSPLGSAAQAFPFAALAIALPFAVWHYRRHGHVHPWRAFLGYSFIFYLIIACFLVILPLPDLPPGTAKADWNKSYALVRKPQLNPVGFLEYIQRLPAGMRRTLAIFQAAFNVGLLLPFGFYLVYLFRVSILATGLAGFLLSLLFELSQLTGIFWLYPGPYRLFDIGDLILNTSGAFIGAALAAILARQKILPDLAMLKGPDTPWIGVFRRGTAFIIDGVAVAASALGLSWIGGLIRPGILSLEACAAIAIAFWFLLLPVVDGGSGLGKRLVFCAVRRRNGKGAGIMRLLGRQAATWSIPIVTLILGKMEGLPIGLVPFLIILWAALFAANAASAIVGKEHESWIDRKLGIRVRNTWKAGRKPAKGDKLPARPHVSRKGTR